MQLESSQTNLKNKVEKQYKESTMLLVNITMLVAIIYLLFTIPFK